MGNFKEMKRTKQLGFELLEHKNVKLFGGSLLKGHAKVKRPITTGRPMHLVMRSLIARGPKSFLRYDRAITNIINSQGLRFGVKIYRNANAGNHIHLIVLPRSRRAFNGFIRAVTGLVARLVLKKERGSSKDMDQQDDKFETTTFWEKRPFTRILEWGRDYKRACDYLTQNTLEALGFIPYKPRGLGRKQFKESTA